MLMFAFYVMFRGFIDDRCAALDTAAQEITGAWSQTSNATIGDRLVDKDASQIASRTNPMLLVDVAFNTYHVLATLRTC
jgi:hypothetical protein